MAATGTITGTITTNSRHWRVTITGVTSGSNSTPFIGRGYQNSSFVLKGTLGGATVNLQGSNDSGTTWVNIGSTISALPASGTCTPNGMNFQMYQVLVTGGDGTTSISGDIDFASNNAS